MARAALKLTGFDCVLIRMDFIEGVKRELVHCIITYIYCAARLVLYFSFLF